MKHVSSCWQQDNKWRTSGTTAPSLWRAGYNRRPEVTHLTVIAVRQEHHKSALTHPLRLTTAQELVKHHLHSCQGALIVQLG